MNLFLLRLNSGKCENKTGKSILSASLITEIAVISIGKKLCNLPIICLERIGCNRDPAKFCVKPNKARPNRQD